MPEAQLSGKENPEDEAPDTLVQKGLPVQAASAAWTRLRHFAALVWNFILEAKDLKQSHLAGYRIKKLFRDKTTQEQEKEMSNLSEEYFLEQIRLEPRNLENYAGLARFYSEKEMYADARDIYAYLVAHAPTNAEYFSRLASSHFRLQDFENAAENYRKSLALDSAQPNRYYNLGLSLEKLGRQRDALPAFKEAARLEPSNDKYKQALERVSKTK